MSNRWEYIIARWEGDSDYLSNGNQRLYLEPAGDYINELEAQLAHTQKLLRCVERDISGEPYIEHYENNDWFRAKEKALAGGE